MIKFISTIIFLFFFVPAYPQNNTPGSDTLRHLVKKTFEIVKQYSVYRQKVDWATLESEVLNGLDTLNRFEDFAAKVSRLFSTMGDDHGALYINGTKIGAANKPVISIREPLLNAYKQKPGPIRYQTRIVGDKYGYIFIPGNEVNENVSALAQALQDSLCQLNPGKLKGIIIDLRLNEGGSIIPLFSGLHQLLGNKNVGAFTDYEGKAKDTWNVKNGKYRKGGSTIVKTRCNCSDNVKVAVLLSQITASAGEMLAIAFKGRKNTIFIGEKTYGLTTGTAAFRIDGYLLGVATSLTEDRTGKRYNSFVSPDIEIIEGDDFQNLSNDLKIKKAIEWFKEN